MCVCVCVCVCTTTTTTIRYFSLLVNSRETTRAHQFSLDAVCVYICICASTPAAAAGVAFVSSCGAVVATAAPAASICKLPIERRGFRDDWLCKYIVIRVFFFLYFFSLPWRRACAMMCDLRDLSVACQGVWRDGRCAARSQLYTRLELMNFCKNRSGKLNL